MTHPHYHINLFWSAEDACWIADVPDLKYCSAHGSTAEEAARAIQIAIEAWLAVAAARGEPAPPPRYRPAIYAVRDAARSPSAPRGEIGRAASRERGWTSG